MSTSLNVLLSSAGRRVELLEMTRAVLAHSGLDGHIIATDCSPYAPALYRADEHYLVPPCTDTRFITRVRQLCRDRSIRLVIPTIDPELELFARHDQDFLNDGVTVAISGTETVRLAADKSLFHSFLSQNGLPTVRQASLEEVIPDSASWDFPLVVKPPRGSASLGVRIVRSVEELKTLVGQDLLVQSLAHGQEYTIDIFADRRGVIRSAIPRKRIEVRAGEVSKGVTKREASLVNAARSLCKCLPDPFGPLNVQVFWDEESDSVEVVELNARFGGGYPLSEVAGGNFLRYLMDIALGQTPDWREDWREDLVMLRYDAGVYLDRLGIRPASDPL